MIDPTARVADGARIGDAVEVGPYCIVGPQVELGARVRLIAHVCVSGLTTIGPGTVVHPFASLGTPPQSVHYRGGPTRLAIGENCEVRESVTMNSGTEDGGGITRVGNRCFLMVGAHVAHDCQVGDNVTFANYVVLGGHVSVGDHAFLGGHVAIHQFVRVGECAMIAGLSGVAADIIPFGFALGQVGRLVGLNTVGLQRRGATRAELHRLRRAYRAMFLGEGVFADRVAAVAREFSGERRVEKIVAFIRAGGERPVMQSRIGRKNDERGDYAA